MQTQLLKLVKETRPLFWSIGDNHLQDLNESSVVETILNYGNLDHVKHLFQVLGTQKVATIFYAQVSQKRPNYYPQVSNFFDKYFRRHVQKYS
jgi:hypothetical protein